MRRVREGKNVHVGGCIAEPLGFFRHHILFSEVVVLVVDCNGRGVPLGMTWSLKKPDYDRLRWVHRSMLLRCLG